MRRLYLVPLLLGATVLFLAVLSCATVRPIATPAARVAPAPTAPDGTTSAVDSVPALSILVQNEDFYDADVYLVSNDAVVRRLGTVIGKTEHRFLVTGRLVAAGEQLALYARTIGEGQIYRSGAISIFAGLGLRWTLQDRGLEWLVPWQQADL